MNRIDEIVAALNQYEATHSVEEISGPAVHNIWQDVILTLPEYDEDLTSAHDSGQNDRFAVSGETIGRDAHLICYDEQRKAWYDSLSLN